MENTMYGVGFFSTDNGLYVHLWNSKEENALCHAANAREFAVMALSWMMGAKPQLWGCLDRNQFAIERMNPK